MQHKKGVCFFLNIWKYVTALTDNGPVMERHNLWPETELDYLNDLKWV